MSKKRSGTTPPQRPKPEDRPGSASPSRSGRSREIEAISPAARDQPDPGLEEGTTNEGEIDPKRLAAYRLGFVSRDLRVWLHVSWSATGIDDPWGGFSSSIRLLRESRLALADEIRPNLFQALGDTLDRLASLFVEVDDAWLRDDESIPWGEGNPPGENLLLELQQLADRILGEGHALRGWYEFGAALGDYRLAIHDPRLSVAAIRDMVTAPDFGRVIDVAERLPEAEVRKIPLLDSLVRLVPVFRRKGQAAFFRKFVDVNSKAGRLRTRADDPIPIVNLMTEIDSRLQEGLEKVTSRSSNPKANTSASDRMVEMDSSSQGGTGPDKPASQLSADDSHQQIPPKKKEDPRLRFMYDEYQKGTKLGTIAAMLPEQHSEWSSIESNSGVLAAVKRFAKRHGLPLVQRQKSRKQKP